VLKDCGRAIYKQGLIELGFKVKRYPRWPTGEMSAERKEWLSGLFRAGRAVLAKKAA
jgi:hypothetical protein